MPLPPTLLICIYTYTERGKTKWKKRSVTFLSCVRIYRPSFRENKPKLLVFSHWKWSFSACFCENWVYKVGHWYCKQGCEWDAKSLNRERESRPRIGSDATFFWDSCSNLEIDDNFRISHNLGLGLAANISTALAIQPDRYQEWQ